LDQNYSCYKSHLSLIHSILHCSS